MAEHNKTYKAFVSSTFKDLKDHRAHVISSLRNAGFFVDPMEDWPADSDEPKKFSRERLHDCDLCLLLVAFRRGHVPDDETRSITQLEYDAAVKQGIDVVPFLLDERVAWFREFDELDKEPGIRVWREQLEKHHGVKYFGSESRSIDLVGTLGRWLSKKNGSQSNHRDRQRIDWPKDKSPYPGLLWFNEDYAPLYFGRDREVEAVLAKMREPQGRLLIISGDSGSGKSSLVAAGLWRALVKEGRISGSRQWRWLRMTPGAGTSGPFVKLAMTLQQAFPHMTVPMDVLAGALEHDPTAWKNHITTHLIDGQELVLFIDQLEELFTQKYPADRIQSFLACLVTSSGDLRNRLRVVTTIRSDFWGRLAESESITQKINDGSSYLVGPIMPTALLEMIQRPADEMGYTFEPGLVDEILEEAGKEPGNLPLVAYALNQLFEQQQDRTFTRAKFKEMGGVAGAIGSKADQVVQSLGGEAQAAFDRVFAELVHLERDRPPTRTRAPLAAFQNPASATKLIETLAGRDCRILVTSEQAQEPMVEVAHEKLFTAWPTLKQWIDASGEALRDIDHAEEEARRWQSGGDTPQELWLSSRAKKVLDALERFGKRSSPALQRFLRPQEALIARLKEDALSHQDRLLIGHKLAEFGDTRPGVGVKDGVPDIEWIKIPGGKIALEKVTHVFQVKPFKIAKYPVTNAQFEAFIQAKDGYRNDEWWRNMRKRDAADEPTWKEANCPRETVSWFEVVAFCRWLSHQTGLHIRLPTEWEWQQAASGGDPTCEYPWGEWDAARCNSDESRLRRTTAVGMYPRGATQQNPQQGVLDMAGNVWEWCLSTHEHPEAAESLRIDESKDTLRVLRGGSWSDTPEVLRVSYLSRGYAVNRYNTIGFRLAQDIS